MKIVYNPACTGYTNLITDIDIAKKSGYDGIEMSKDKLYRYLDAGMSIDYINEYLDGFEVTAIGYIPDIERQGKNETVLLKEMEHLCIYAEKLNCRNIQVLTGPLALGVLGNPNYPNVKLTDEYSAFINLDWQEMKEITVKNLKKLCDIAAASNISLYSELLGRSPAGPYIAG